MECNRVLFTAIIDSGSTINVMNKRIWEQIKLPMDTSNTIIMHDANGGQEKLDSCVERCPLICGAPVTYGRIYVSTKANFPLLLGRPWLRYNFVSLEERPKGTYLVFNPP
ncbi:hypothetical protein BV22DRAFT_1026072, partial [Leucogyrophana mollusca]